MEKRGLARRGTVDSPHTTVTSTNSFAFFLPKRTTFNEKKKKKKFDPIDRGVPPPLSFSMNVLWSHGRRENVYRTLETQLTVHFTNSWSISARSILTLCVWNGFLRCIWKPSKTRARRTRGTMEQQQSNETIRNLAEVIVNETRLIEKSSPYDVLRS